MCQACRTLVSVLYISGNSLQFFLCFQQKTVSFWFEWFGAFLSHFDHTIPYIDWRVLLWWLSSHTPLKLHFLCCGNMFHNWMRKDSFCNAITGVNCGGNACRNLCLTITHGLFCFNWSNYFSCHIHDILFIIFRKLSPLCLVLGCLSLWVISLCCHTLFHKWYDHVSTALSVHQICISLPMFLSWWRML